MIKIKNNIFNENDIRRIYYNKDKSCLCVVFRDKDLVTNWVKNATFEDIEWNYGNNISESLSYDLAKAKIKQLEEENKDLYRQIDSIMKLNSDAARYILDNCIDEKTGRISNPDILKIFKFLSNGGEPIINKEEE